VEKTLSIGPLAVPMELAVFFVAVIVALGVDALFRRIRKTQGESPLFTILMVAVVVSRIAFVTMYLDEYMQTPWKIVDFRDGGFSPLAGMLAGAATAGWYFIRQMGGRATLVVSIALGALAWAAGTLVLTAEREDAAGLPSARFTALDGEPLELESFSGKPIVVNLWATWCPPCIREMPVLRDAQQKNKDITFVFINQGESHATVSAFLQSRGLALSNVALDPTMTAMRDWNAGALPTTVFLDATGRIADSRIGELSAATLSQRLAAIRTAGN